MKWIWQHAEFPSFHWDYETLQPLLSEARLLQGTLLGIARTMELRVQQRLTEHALTEELLTTSAIEGEILDRDSVRSSLANRLHLAHAGVTTSKDRYVEGLVDVVLDAIQERSQPLTLEMLFAWQAALFPTGYSGVRKVEVGQLRGAGDMEIISGPTHKPKRHYLAPPSETLTASMNDFLIWFNTTKIDGILKAGVAHVWFEILHPFDDGNGRVGRTLIERALAQDEGLSVRYYSISQQIMSARKAYYAQLRLASIGGMDITQWLVWFIKTFSAAIRASLALLETLTLKSQFWQHHSQTLLNARQIKALNRMLDEGLEGFIGGMTTKKYGHLTKTSRATAYRELQDLVKKACLKPLPEKGRSSAYAICYPTSPKH